MVALCVPRVRVPARVQTPGARICVHVTMETHLLLQLWGICMGPRDIIRRQEYSVSAGMLISQIFLHCDAAAL